MGRRSDVEQPDKAALLYAHIQVLWSELAKFPVRMERSPEDQRLAQEIRGEVDKWKALTNGRS